MNNKIVIAIVALLVGLGLGYPLFHHGGEQVLGGVYETNVSHYGNGFYAGQTDQYSVDSSGNVSTTGTVTASAIKLTSSNFAVSSSSPAALGAATRGEIVVAASATTANASSTAIAANSLIFYEPSATTTIPGVTCNTALASSTQTSSKIPGSGFIVKVSPAPTTNPYCLDFHIINP